MASKKVNHAWAWGAWVTSCILFISLFLQTKQYGLLFMNLMGLGINALGYWQWSRHKNINMLAMKIAFNLSILGVTASCVLFGIFVSQYKKELIEWGGAILSISGTLLLASKHNKAALSWLIWLVSNIILLIFGIYNKQWGFATLQLGFTISNIYGIIMWLWIKKEPIGNHW